MPCSETSSPAVSTCSSARIPTVFFMLQSTRNEAAKVTAPAAAEQASIELAHLFSVDGDRLGGPGGEVGSQRGQCEEAEGQRSPDARKAVDGGRPDRTRGSRRRVSRTPCCDRESRSACHRRRTCRYAARAESLLRGLRGHP